MYSSVVSSVKEVDTNVSFAVGASLKQTSAKNAAYRLFGYLVGRSVLVFRAVATVRFSVQRDSGIVFERVCYDAVAVVCRGHFGVCRLSAVQQHLGFRGGG